MSYRTTPTIGQSHGNSCWAACLSWWLKAVGGGRPSWTQKEIMNLYWKSVDETGAMRPTHMVNVWGTDKRLKMGTGVFATPNATMDRLPIGDTPVCIAFKHFTGFAHMNVIWPNGQGRVWAMEPFFPYPGVNGRRTGQIVDREIQHYNYGDEIILAWADPFAASTP